MQDVVFPDGNEAAFLARAKTLGIKDLVFVYTDPANFYKGNSTIKITNALLANPKTIDKAKNKTKIVLLKSSDQDLHTVEHKSPSILYELEQSPKYDALHQRASGLNHVLARACASNDVAIGFSMQSILSTGPQRRSIIMGRMMQNIKLCRKFKVKMVVASFAKTPGGMRNPADMKSLFTVLGLHPQEFGKKAA